MGAGEGRGGRGPYGLDAEPGEGSKLCTGRGHRRGSGGPQGPCSGCRDTHPSEAPGKATSVTGPARRRPQPQAPRAPARTQDMQSRATDPWPPGTFVLVSRAPSPQKVPPPMELPPTHSNLSSVSTWHRTREKQVPEVWWPRGVPWHGRDALEGRTWAGGECAPLTARGPLPWTQTVGTCVRRAVPAWPWHAAGARHTWAAPSLSHEAEPHLHDGHSGADVDEEVREDVGVIGLEPELGVGVFLTHEGFVWDVL